MPQYCRRCGNPLNGNEKFCRKCGEPIHQASPAKIQCPSCGKEVNAAAVFCPHCGKEIVHEDKKETAAQSESKKDDKRKMPVWIYFAIAGGLIGGILLGKGITSDSPSASVPAAAEHELEFKYTTDSDELRIDAAQTVIDCREFVNIPDNAQVSAEPAELDLAIPKTTEVTFTCIWDDDLDNPVIEKKVIQIIDQDGPEIVFKEKEITIDAGSSYDINDNIDRVYDSVDGVFALSKEEEPGAYTIVGNTDFSNAGIYEFTVSAVDSSGNRSTDTFTVKAVSQERFVAIPEGCSSQRKDYDKLFSEMEIYGKEYTSPAYSTKSEMEHALREFEKEKYPDLPCQVYPAVHIEDGNESQWIFYDYNPWDD